jgi:hypothetical protein
MSAGFPPLLIQNSFVFYPTMGISVSSVDSLISFGLSIICMQLSKRISMDVPRCLWTLRAVYILANMVQLAFFFYIRKKILRTNDQRKLKLKKEPSLFQESDAEEEVEMTYAEYDLTEITKSTKSMAVQCLVVLLIHFKWGVIQPMFIQSFAPIKSMFLNPIYTAHVWNQPVLRPFELNMLFQTIPAEPAKKRKKEE